MWALFLPHPVYSAILLKHVCCHCTAFSGLRELSDGYNVCTAENGVPCVCVCVRVRERESESESELRHMLSC